MLKTQELIRAERFSRDIDPLIQGIYMDNTMGKLSDEWFATMSIEYE